MTESTPHERVTILIVDDNVTNLRVAAGHLTERGFQVLTARHGEAGLSRARLARPDLILLDVQMPGIDGFETCRRLKADPDTREIPVIFMTVLDSTEAKLAGFRAGGVDYIPKPFELEEALARVNAHVSLYRLQRDLRREVQERERAEQALQRANLELQRLAVLDELTQLANRRRFDAYLKAQWNTPGVTRVGLLLIDVDHFKQYNDLYGHSAGDQCLRAVARAISRAVGHGADLAARYGGEEFAVILPNTGAQGAALLGESIRREVQELNLIHEGSSVIGVVTVSVGATSMTLENGVNTEVLISTADGALYRAKGVGRNRIVST